MKKFEKSIEQLREDLKAKGIKFGNRSNLATLQKLAGENGIDIDEARNTRSIVPTNYKAAYAARGGTCGDELAAALSELGRDEDGKLDTARLSEIADQNGIDLGRWKHLNIGQQRMNLSNVLRGKLKKGENVQVGKKKFSAAA